MSKAMTIFSLFIQFIIFLFIIILFIINFLFITVLRTFSAFQNQFLNFENYTKV